MQEDDRRRPTMVNDRETGTRSESLPMRLFHFLLDRLSPAEEDAAREYERNRFDQDAPGTNGH
jgi:hypothetical protein